MSICFLFGALAMLGMIVIFIIMDVAIEARTKRIGTVDFETEDAFYRCYFPNTDQPKLEDSTSGNQE